MTIKNYVLESSNLNSIYFDNELDLQDIKINFKTGETYKYFNVPTGVCKNLIAAESAGKYFNVAIKNVYEFTKEV
jgi:hypothetical protein